MQRHFDKDIEELKDLLLRMGAMVEDSIMQSIRSLLERDTALAQEVISNDDRIDQMELEIDRRTLELIAKMQPTAVDLRFVATVMKVTPELERIADLAQDVCERVIELNREPPLKAMVAIPRLAQDAQGMVRDALDALVRRDVALARSVITQDDSVDQWTCSPNNRSASCSPTCWKTRATFPEPSASRSSGSISSAWRTARPTSARWSSTSWKER